MSTPLEDWPWREIIAGGDGVCPWCERPAYGRPVHRCCELAAIQGQSGCRACRASWAQRRPLTIEQRVAIVRKRAAEAKRKAPKCEGCGRPILLGQDEHRHRACC